jgi:hypothetical protein
MPKLQSNVFVGSKKRPATWTSKCTVSIFSMKELLPNLVMLFFSGFNSNVATAALSDDGLSINVKIVSSDPVDASNVAGCCEDAYMIISTSMFKMAVPVRYAGTMPSLVTEVEVTVPADLTAAEQWDLDNKGLRIMSYPLDTAGSYSSLVKTLALFIPEATLSVPDYVEKMNIDMQTKYSHFPVTAIDPASLRIPDASEVHSGDAFYVHRLDGLNVLLGWAMGSTNGHVTTAIWMDGELYICESTIQDSYWPTDFVQKTPYATWIKQAQDADMQVLWVPLSEEARARYDEQKVSDYFKSVEGFDYGFKTLVFGWLDTPSANFPCLPPDYSSNCLTWELLEPLMGVIDRHIPQIGDMIWNPGMAMRMGVPDTLRTADLFKVADDKGMQSVDLISIPEQDTWMYNTTR